MGVPAMPMGRLAWLVFTSVAVQAQAQAQATDGEPVPLARQVDLAEMSSLDAHLPVFDEDATTQELAKVDCNCIKQTGKGTCSDACCCFTKEVAKKSTYSDGEKFAVAWVGSKKDAGGYPDTGPRRKHKKHKKAGHPHMGMSGNTQKHRKKRL